MIKKIDTQLEKYDERVDSSLNVIKTTPLGQIPLEDLKKALKEMKHGRPIDFMYYFKRFDISQSCAQRTSTTGLEMKHRLCDLYV